MSASFEHGWRIPEIDKHLVKRNLNPLLLRFSRERSQPPDNADLKQCFVGLQFLSMVPYFPLTLVSGHTAGSDFVQVLSRMCAAFCLMRIDICQAGSVSELS